MRGLFRVRKNENESIKKFFILECESFRQLRMCHEGIKGKKLIGTISKSAGKSEENCWKFNFYHEVFYRSGVNGDFMELISVTGVQ